jgi:hypothetical protein
MENCCFVSISFIFYLNIMTWFFSVQTIPGSSKAQPYTLIQAKALAMAAIDVYCQPHLVEKMRTELQDALESE